MLTAITILAPSPPLPLPPLTFTLQFHAEARVGALLAALRMRFRQQLQGMLDAPLSDAQASPVVAGKCWGWGVSRAMLKRCCYIVQP